MGLVIHIDKQGGGGSGIGWSGQVEFRGDLPITIGDPVVGTIYLVEKKTTLLGFTTYQSGLYIRDTNAGALSDWRRLNVKVQFTDSEFTVVQAADNTAKAKFDLSLVSTSTTRTLTVPNKSGTIALLSDVEASDTLAEVLANGNTTGANDIIVNTNQKILNDKVTDPATLNLAADIFNDPNIFTTSFRGALAAGNILTGFVYYATFDFSAIYLVGNQIQLKDTNGNVNDGFHTLTGVAFDVGNNRTEFQWAGMTPILPAPFGEFTEYDGKDWRLGTSDSSFQSYPSQFQLVTNKQVFQFTFDYYFQLNTAKTVRRGQYLILNDDTETVDLKVFDFNGAFGDWTFGGITVVNVRNQPYTSTAFAKSPPSLVSSQNSTLIQGLYNSVILAGLNIIAKTNNTAYLNQLAFNLGGAFETVIDHTVATADRLQTLQDADGTIALVGVDTFKQKAGRVLNAGFSGNPKKSAAIVFATPYPNADYSVVVTANTQANTTFSVDIESKTATGFVINTHANNITNLIDVTWITSDFGEN